MHLSFTEHLDNIIKAAGGNQLLENLLLRSLLANLPDSASKKLKSIWHQYYLDLSNAPEWRCQYRGCNEKSCWSHEISENAALKNLCSNSHEVAILKRDLVSNPTNYVIGLQHRRNATTFPGYCAIHDAELFADIDSGDIPFDLHYVNKQCMRTTRAEVFRLQHQLNSSKAFVRNIPDDLRHIDDVIDIIKKFEGISARLVKNIDRLWTLHDQIHSGIESVDYFLNYDTIPDIKPGFCCAICSDSTEENDVKVCVNYLLKLDLKSGTEAIVAYPNNTPSRDNAGIFIENYRFLFGYLAYHNKRALVLSVDFYKTLSENWKDFFLKDNELYAINPKDPASTYFLSQPFIEELA